ncbi:MAG: glycosyltransferase family 2 protein, partial [Elusimicrobiota bacterium]|nr:glycosyltransferase family 2 protein [Elusimicrobiota bacterium]
VRAWRGEGSLERVAGRAGLARCRAVVVVDGPLAVEAVQRVAYAAPRLPVALARFEAGPDDWVARIYPGTGTPEAVWDLPTAGGRAALRAALAARLDVLLAPRAPDDGAASVIIPCWNGLAYTRRCLKALARWTTRPYEVVVVDNGSTDGTGAFLRGLRDPRVRVITNARNRGFAAAVNQGLEAATGKWLVWLNNDVLVTPRWLEGLVGCAQRHPRAGAVGPYTNRINGLQRVADARYALASLPGFASAWALRHAGRARSVHRLTGFCLLHSRESLEAVGRLDERFGLGCYEDFDFCLRLLQAGRELLLAEDVFVHHFGHKSFEANKVARAHIEANRRLFVDKWCRRAMLFLDLLDPELERR